MGSHDGEAGCSRVRGDAPDCPDGGYAAPTVAGPTLSPRRTLWTLVARGSSGHSAAETVHSGSPASRTPAQSQTYQLHHIESLEDPSDRSASGPLVLPMPPRQPSDQQRQVHRYYPTDGIAGGVDAPRANRHSNGSGSGAGSVASVNAAGALHHDSAVYVETLPLELRRMSVRDQDMPLAPPLHPSPMRRNAAALLARGGSSKSRLAAAAGAAGAAASATQCDRVPSTTASAGQQDQGAEGFSARYSTPTEPAVQHPGQELPSGEVRFLEPLPSPAPAPETALPPADSAAATGSDPQAGADTVTHPTSQGVALGATAPAPAASKSLPPVGTSSRGSEAQPAVALFLTMGLAAGAAAVAAAAVLVSRLQAAMQAWLPPPAAVAAAADAAPPQTAAAATATSQGFASLSTFLQFCAGAALLAAVYLHLRRRQQRQRHMCDKALAAPNGSDSTPAHAVAPPQAPPHSAEPRSPRAAASAQPTTLDRGGLTSPFTTQMSPGDGSAACGCAAAASDGGRGRPGAVAARGLRGSSPLASPSLHAWAVPSAAPVRAARTHGGAGAAGADAFAAARHLADDASDGYEADAEVRLGDRAPDACSGGGSVSPLTPPPPPAQWPPLPCAAADCDGGGGGGANCTCPVGDVDAQATHSAAAGAADAAKSAAAAGTASVDAPTIAAASRQGSMRSSAGAVVGAGARWLRMAVPGLSFVTPLPRRRAPSDPNAGGGGGGRAAASIHGMPTSSGVFMSYSLGPGGAGSAAAQPTPQSRDLLRRFSSPAAAAGGVAAMAASLASAAAASAAALCAGLLRPAALPPAYGSLALPPLPGGGASGLGGHGSGQQTRASSGVVAHMVSDFLPRVAGGWAASHRSASTTSLTALAEAAAGGGGGGTFSGGAGGGGTGGGAALLLSTAEAVVVRKPAFSDLPQNAGRVQVLSVDDEPVNQQVMRALLWAAEYEVLEARSGEEALELVRRSELLPDLVLLDVTLGGDVSGFEVCREIRREYSAGELPVIMITCSSLEEDVIRGLAVGANDYMIKPLRNLELMARIKTQLALKRSIRVAAEARVNMSLLASILPANVIRQLKQGVTLIAQFHQEVTILFSDIRGFTNLATEWPTEQIILMLNNMFTAFDRLCDQLGVYKVETIGDAYMIVSGHDGVADHAPRMLRMAAAMLEAVADMRGFDGRELQIRVGIHTGPAHSGVVGLSRPRYCFFGDTVNTASRMESTGFPMAVQVSESTLRMVQSRPEWASAFAFVPCGPRDIKGKGTMHTYLLRVGLYDNALAELAAAAAARASATAKRRRASALIASAAAVFGAAAGRAAGDGNGDGDMETLLLTGEALNAAAAAPATAIVPAPATPAAALSPAPSPLPLALPLTVPPGFGSSGGSAGRGAARPPAASIDLLPSETEHLKYASWRYHHANTGLDMASSAGTNVIYDNPLMMVGSNHGTDPGSLDTLEMSPSAISRFTPAAAASGASGISGLAAHPHGALWPGGAAAAAGYHGASGVLSPAASTRPSLEVSAFGSSQLGGGGAPYNVARSSYSRTASGFSVGGGGGSGASGLEFRRSASIRSSGAAAAAGGGGGGADTSKPGGPAARPAVVTVSSFASAAVASGSASATEQELSLRQVASEFLDGADRAAAAAAAPALPPSATAAARRWADAAAARLRRSRARTSDELSAMAAAAKAAGIGRSDGVAERAFAVAAAAAAAATASNASRDSNDPTVFATSMVSGVEGSTSQLLGLPMLADEVDATEIMTRRSAEAADTGTLGAWIPPNASRERTLGHGWTAPLVPATAPADAPAGDGGAGGKCSGSGEVSPTPAVAVAAEALAEAVDSALYGIAGGGDGDAMNAPPRRATVPPMSGGGVAPREPSVVGAPSREARTSAQQDLPQGGSGGMSSSGYSGLRRDSSSSRGAASPGVRQASYATGAAGGPIDIAVGAVGGSGGDKTASSTVFHEAWTKVLAAKRPATSSGTRPAVVAAGGGGSGSGGAPGAAPLPRAAAANGYGGIYGGLPYGTAAGILSSPRRRAATGNGFGGGAADAAAAAWGRDPNTILVALEATADEELSPGLAAVGGGGGSMIGSAAASAAQRRAWGGPSSPAAASDASTASQRRHPPRNSFSCIGAIRQVSGASSGAAGFGTAAGARDLSRADSQGSAGPLGVGGGSVGGGAMVVSRGSLGGVSIIGAGWSNLYEAAQTRAQVAGSTLSRSTSIQQPGDTASIAPSSAQLTPANSTSARVPLGSPSPSNGGAAGGPSDGPAPAGHAAGPERSDVASRVSQPAVAPRMGPVVPPGPRFAATGALSPSAAGGSALPGRSRSMDVSYRHNPLSPRSPRPPASPHSLVLGARGSDDRQSLVPVCEEEQLLIAALDDPRVVLVRGSQDRVAGPLPSSNPPSVDNVSSALSDLPGYEHLEEYSRRHAPQVPSMGQMTHGSIMQGAGPMVHHAFGAPRLPAAANPALRRTSMDVVRHAYAPRTGPPGAAGTAVISGSRLAAVSTGAAGAADAKATEQWFRRHSVDVYALPRSAVPRGGAAAPTAVVGSGQSSNASPLPLSPTSPDHSPLSPVDGPRSSCVVGLPSGPGPFGSPVSSVPGAAVPIVGNRAAAAGGGGVDIARMLARATELVAADAGTGGGGGGGIEGSHTAGPSQPNPQHPGQALQHHQQSQGRRLHSVRANGGGDAGGLISAAGARSPSTPGLASPATADHSQQPVQEQHPPPRAPAPGVAAPAASAAASSLYGSHSGHPQNHYVVHTHGNVHGIHGNSGSFGSLGPHHMGLSRAHGHPQHMLILATRLDPVDECGSSTAVTAEETSSVVASSAGGGGGVLGGATGSGDALRRLSAGPHLAAPAAPPAAATGLAEAAALNSVLSVVPAASGAVAVGGGEPHGSAKAEAAATAADVTGMSALFSSGHETPQEGGSAPQHLIARVLAVDAGEGAGDAAAAGAATHTSKDTQSVAKTKKAPMARFISKVKKALRPGQ